MRDHDRLRWILDVMSTVSVVLVSLTVTWAVLSGRSSATAGPSALRGTTGRPNVPAIPTAPLSVDGAALRGSKSARVAVVEYSDFQCPFCGKFARETMPDVERRYIDTGKILFVFREFPLTTHRYAQQAAITAECAAQQGQFWKMHDALFNDQAHLDEPSLESRVVTIALDPSKFSACRQSVEAAKSITDDVQQAKALGVSATPTFFVGTVQTDGRIVVMQRVSGAESVQTFEGVLDKALAVAVTKSASQ